MTNRARIGEVIAERSRPAESLQMQADLVARADHMIGRMVFELGLRWLSPKHLRLRARRGGVNLIEVLQANDQLTIYLWRLREGYQGPVGDLHPQIARAFPVTDLSALALVPLVETTLVDRFPSLRLRRFSRWSSWRRHLLLTGDPRAGEPSVLSDFVEDQWALRPDTLTVEGLALRLPTPDGDKPLWLFLELQRYESHDVRPGDDTESVIVPTAFRLSLARHPWRRWWRGEIWSLEGRDTRFLLDPPMSPADFELHLGPGATLHPLRAFSGIPLAALDEG